MQGGGGRKWDSEFQRHNLPIWWKDKERMAVGEPCKRRNTGAKEEGWERKGLERSGARVGGREGGRGEGRERRRDRKIEMPGDRRGAEMMGRGTRTPPYLLLVPTGVARRTGCWELKPLSSDPWDTTG